MELNSNLATIYTEVQKVPVQPDGSPGNIIRLSAGLCHTADIDVLKNGTSVSPSTFRALLPSSEFKSRYNLDSASAIIILDNSISGELTIKSKPIGGIYQNIDLSKLPETGHLNTYYGHYLEEYGRVVGLDSFGVSALKTPSRASDIDCLLTGRVSYPGAT